MLSRESRDHKLLVETSLPTKAGPHSLSPHPLHIQPWVPGRQCSAARASGGRRGNGAKQVFYTCLLSWTANLSLPLISLLFTTSAVKQAEDSPRRQSQTLRRKMSRELHDPHHPITGSEHRHLLFPEGPPGLLFHCCQVWNAISPYLTTVGKTWSFLRVSVQCTFSLFPSLKS